MCHLIGRNVRNQKSGTGNSEIRREKKRQAQKTPISINTIRNEQ